MSSGSFLTDISVYGEVRIVPDTSLDSLIATSILFKNLTEHGIKAKLNFDAKLLIDAKDEPAILVNLPPYNPKVQKALAPPNALTTVTGYVAKEMDKAFGIELKDKALALAVALYYNLYDIGGKKFPSVEGEFLEELISKERAREIFGLRLWGVKRNGFATALTRTLVPFFPGLTGFRDRVAGLIQEELNVPDIPYTKYADALNKRDKSVLKLLARIVSAGKPAPEAKQIAETYAKYWGDFVVIVNEGDKVAEYEASELAGSIIVYESLYREALADIALVSFKAEAISQIIAIYDKHIDDLAGVLGSIITPEYSPSKPIDVEDLLERADLLIEIFAHLNKLPKDKPISITKDTGVITSLRELIRIGVKAEEAYSKCDEYQVCEVSKYL